MLFKLKQTVPMAPKKSSSNSSSIPIGNCEVVVEANAFTYKSDQSTLQISVSRKANINISVKEDSGTKNCDSICHFRSEEGEGPSPTGDHFFFLLINPKDANGHNISKSLLQEALNIYSKELPTMNYAANTGKESMFLERCVLNGKYCTLLLKSKSLDGFEEVIAAITYQIIPADTQYAEIPLVAVNSVYQHKGVGCLLYKELRKRLQSVGICTILCWGDKESEGFWLKQGFVSIAEVDTKGRARRLPIKADIRRALCFPGGSTLMVSHLQNGISANLLNSVKLCFPLKSHEKPLSSAVIEQQMGGVRESTYTPTAVNPMCHRTEKSQPEVLVNNHNKLDGCSPRCNALQGCRDPHPPELMDWEKVASGLELNKTVADFSVKHCTCSSGQGVKRIWESSWSSLKSKKVKGGHLIDCLSDSNGDFGLENDGINDSCFNGCTLGTSRHKSLVDVTPRDPSTNNLMEKNAEELKPSNATSKDQLSKEIVSKRECFEIMLMNIADDAKKTGLTKIIEDLGGLVTSDGRVSTHVITGKVRRTLNFCTALCSGAWIVSPSWLKESFREGRFVEESPFILNDEDYKLKYRKELRDAVLKAKTRPRALLKGYNICLASHVQPPVETLSAIVCSAGGNVIHGLNMVNEVSETIFVACEEDMEEALLAVKKGIWTFSSEWFMNCVMRQELDLEAHQFAESL
ncbi:uncharacterized protein LOC131167793 [Malania oleifera]|uniref:uncharacterized protein LOC131167793 n=1 Tax=Malania oleifera TaxID=397392 RepID=UPI0025AE1515|nr:uncharacterized protein LOC131167793 [Malania oleifera]